MKEGERVCVCEREKERETKQDLHLQRIESRVA